MNYYEIKHSAPEGLKKKKRKRSLSPGSVLLFFLVETILMVTFGSMIQMRFMLGGVAITELAMLALSAGFVLLMRADFREVFPIRRPRKGAIAGAAVLWLAAILCVVITSVILMYLFPEPYRTLGDEDTLFRSVSFPVQVLVIAVLPAVCEEALHRGVLQCGIERRVKSIPLLSLIMGAIFAVFHLYPIKYPSMLILGAVMTYILAVTGNMVYSSFVHFLNNMVSLLLDHFSVGIVLRFASLFRKSAVGHSTGDFLLRAAGEFYSDSPVLQNLPVQYVGSSIILAGAPVPLLFYVGRYLLKRATAPVKPSFFPAGEKHPARNQIVIPTLLIILFGVIVAML